MDDNADLLLSYRNGVGIFEGSWDLPRSFQQLDIFGLKGSVSVQSAKVEVRKGVGVVEEVAMKPLPADRAEPIAYMVDCIRAKKAPEGLVAMDINVGVNEIIEAAKMSVGKQSRCR